MPMLDVTDILLSPEFMDTFSVKRRAETVGENGRSAVSVASFCNIGGVVRPAGKNDMERLDDNQRGNRTIAIRTTFNLQGPVRGRQPDLVVWAGDTFVVVDVQPWRFGKGFFSVLAQSVDSVESPL